MIMYDDLYRGMDSRSGKQARLQVVRYYDDDNDDDAADCYNSNDHNLNYDNDDAVDDNDTFNDNADHNDNTIYVIYKGSSRRSKSRR